MNHRSDVCQQSTEIFAVQSRNSLSPSRTSTACHSFSVHREIGSGRRAWSVAIRLRKRRLTERTSCGWKDHRLPMDKWSRPRRCSLEHVVSREVGKSMIRSRWAAHWELEMFVLQALPKEVDWTSSLIRSTGHWSVVEAFINVQQTCLISHIVSITILSLERSGGNFFHRISLFQFSWILTIQGMDLNIWLWDRKERWTSLTWNRKCRIDWMTVSGGSNPDPLHWTH
jgi:hypothetical protein